MRWLLNLAWPRDAKPEQRWTALFRAVASVLLLVSTVLNGMGVKLAQDSFQPLVLGALGIWLLSFLVDSNERRGLLVNQEALLKDFRTVVGLRVKELSADAIGPAIEKALESSDYWLFRGGSGRYLRAATLPRLSQITHQEVPVSIHILDPRDDALCREYARYRALGRAQTLRRGDEHDYRTIRSDLLANIYAAGWYKANSRIQPEVVLMRSFSPLRYDLSSTVLLATVADPSSAALAAESGTWYFDSIKDELSQNRHGHPEVILPTDNHIFPRDKAVIDGLIVKEGLMAMRVSDPVTSESRPLLETALTDEIDFDEVAEKVFLSESPY